MALVITLVGVLVITFIWMKAGFFNAMLHFACVLSATTVAFAFWEPVTTLVLDMGGKIEFFRDSARAVGLVVPFILSLAIFRVAMDSLIRANVNVNDITNNVGGIAVGLMSAYVSVGVLGLAVGNLRVPYEGWTMHAGFTDSSNGRGSIVRKEGFVSKFMPDAVVSKVFGMMSESTMRPINDTLILATAYPEGVAEWTSASRITAEDKARHIGRPNEYRVDRWYTFANDSLNDDIPSLLQQDGWTPGTGTAHKVLDMDGRSIDRGYLVGYEVIFNTSAIESGRGAQVIVGNPQVRLLCRSTQDADDVVAVRPAAAYSRPQPGDPSLTPATPLGGRQQAVEPLKIGRWRFDTDNVFVGSVAGEQDPHIIFEFAVPTGYVPESMTIKGIRTELNRLPEQVKFSTQRKRDEGVSAWLGSRAPDIGGRTTTDPSETQRVKIVTQNPRANSNERLLNDIGINIGPSFGFMIQDGIQRILKIDKSDSSRPVVIGGEETFRSEQLKPNGVVPRNLQIRAFGASGDTQIVKVDISLLRPLGAPASVADKGSPPLLIDEQNLTYGAIGYIYEDEDLTRIRFTPDKPLEGLGSAPALSRTKGEAKLQLVFRVTGGAKIKEFRIGDKIVADFSEAPWSVDQR